MIPSTRRTNRTHGPWPILALLLAAAILAPAMAAETGAPAPAPPPPPAPAEPATAVAPAPAEAAITAEQILDQYIEAIGGKAAWDKIQSMVVKTTTEVKPEGLKAEGTAWYARPAKYHYLVVPKEGETEERGTDGTVFWHRSPSDGPLILTGEDRTQAILDVRLDKLLSWREIYGKGEYTGTEEILGVPCQKVVLQAPGSGRHLFYFQTGDHLLAKEVFVKMGMNQRRIVIEVFYRDYKKVGDVQIPHTVVTGVMEKYRVETVTSVELNAKIPADRFALPKDVKETAEKVAAQAGAAAKSPTAAPVPGSQPR